MINDRLIIIKCQHDRLATEAINKVYDKQDITDLLEQMHQLHVEAKTIKEAQQ
jgi:hypothetical protein